MTLLSIDGFEAGDYVARYATTTSMVRSTTTRFGSGFSLSQQNGYWMHGLPAPTTKLTVGFVFYYPAANNGDLVTFLADANTVQHCVFAVTSVGAVVLKRNGVILATSAASLVLPATWNYLEFTGSIHDTTGYMSARVNGTEIISFTGDTRNNGTSMLTDTVRFLPCGINQVNFWDDMYILNDLGPAPYNAPLGDCRVQTLVPTGAGSTTQLTPVGSASNWDNVDEFPPSMTDYNFSSTPGQRDLYTMSDLVLGTTTILGVAANSSALKNDAGSRSIINTVKTGGTVFGGGARALSTAQQTQTGIWQVNPDTGVAWTPAEVNAIEAGVEVV